MNKKFKIIFSSLIGFVTISIFVFTTLVSKFPGLTLGIKGCEYIVTENSGGYYSIVITKLTGNTLYIPANVIDISIASYIGDNKLDRIVVDYENEEYYVEDECLVKNDRILLGANGSTFTFNNNVTTIGQWAFAYCDKIENISIPSTITTIEDFAFANCQNINTIYIPKDVETIKDNVFYECKNLNIYTETPSDNAGWNKYWNCGFQVRYNIDDGANGRILNVNNFQYILYKERQTATLLKYLGKDEEVVIPDVINYNNITYNVTNALSSALSSCKNITKLVLPTLYGEYLGYLFGATTYEENSDYVPTSLKKVILKNTSVIYANAFYNCNNLTSLEIPNTLKSIEENAFVNCTRLYEIINNSNLNFMPGSKDYYGIASSAFMVNNRGTITYRDNNVTADTYNYIETEDKFIFMQYGDKYYLLSYKGKEETPVLPYKINNRTYYCQYMDNTLSNIKLSNDFIEIPDQMFSNSKYLNSIKLPVSVLSIESRAFKSCSSLTSIEIPSSITSIGDDAFSGCTNLTSIEIPSSITSIGDDAFNCCSSLTSIEIPNSVISIGNSAFKGCSSLTSMEIPNSVTSIGNSAFEGVVV